MSWTNTTKNTSIYSGVSKTASTYVNASKQLSYLEYLMTEADDYLVTQAEDYLITNQSMSWFNKAKS
jgi:hypothetical protein